MRRSEAQRRAEARAECPGGWLCGCCGADVSARDCTCADDLCGCRSCVSGRERVSMSGAELDAYQSAIRSARDAIRAGGATCE